MTKNSLESRTVQSFGFEWNKTIPLHENLAEFDFFKKLFHTEKNEFKGKEVLDIGSGNGQYSDFALRLGAKSITCLDISDALNACGRNLEKMHFDKIKKMKFIKKSILELKANKKYDSVLLIGVAQHTVNPRLAVKKAIDCLKKDGTLYFWGYEDNLAYKLSFHPLRKITTCLPHRLLWKLTWVPAVLVKFPLLNIPLRCAGISNRELLEERRLSIFDAFATPITHFHTQEELESWFKEFDCIYEITSEPSDFWRRLLGMKYKNAFAFKIKRKK